MNRKQDVFVEEENSRKKFKSNDNKLHEDDDGDENADEVTTESELDLDTAATSKHEQLFGIKARINKYFKRFQAVLKKMFALF